MIWTDTSKNKKGQKVHGKIILRLPIRKKKLKTTKRYRFTSVRMLVSAGMWGKGNSYKQLVKISTGTATMGEQPSERQHYRISNSWVAKRKETGMSKRHLQPLVYYSTSHKHQDTELTRSQVLEPWYSATKIMNEEVSFTLSLASLIFEGGASISLWNRNELIPYCKKVKSNLDKKNAEINFGGESYSLCSLWQVEVINPYIIWLPGCHESRVHSKFWQT